MKRPQLLRAPGTTTLTVPHILAAAPHDPRPLDEREDPLAAARGILNALALVLAGYAVAFGLWLLIVAVTA